MIPVFWDVTLLCWTSGSWYSSWMWRTTYPATCHIPESWNPLCLVFFCILYSLSTIPWDISISGTCCNNSAPVINFRFTCNEGNSVYEYRQVHNRRAVV
jgi:hypothetical protein